jgi:hypothetical protein
LAWLCEGLATDELDLSLGFFTRLFEGLLRADWERELDLLDALEPDVDALSEGLGWSFLPARYSILMAMYSSRAAEELWEVASRSSLAEVPGLRRSSSSGSVCRSTCWHVRRNGT